MADPLEGLLQAALGEMPSTSEPQTSFDDALSSLNTQQKTKPKLDNDQQPKNAAKKLSTIHSGDTDSSDDEDNRDHENRKYNESGRNIKHLLDATKPRTSHIYNTSNLSNKTWLKNANPKTTIKPKTQSSEYLFGIRVINPLVSSNTLEERMVGREVVLFSKVKMFVRNISADKDWVIAGVIVSKSPVKISQSGKNYFMWTLSDLKVDLKSVTVFMFGNACKELWKTTVGTVVGILNPQVLDLKEGSKDDACLSINNHQLVMILGQSKDLGTCKSMKKSGERCTAFVNVAICEFCIYHVRQEYQKCSQRSELQSGFAGRGLTALRNKVLGKDQVFYAGKLYTAIPASKNKKQVAKDQKRLSALAGLAAYAKIPPKTQKQKQAACLELSIKERQRDLARLKQLGVINTKNLDGPAVKFNAGLSRDVSAEDSKNIALDVIGKLTKNKNTNLNGAKSENLRTLGNSEFNLNERVENFNADLSKDVSAESSKNLALDVISKLKKKGKSGNLNDKAPNDGLETTAQEPDLKKMHNKPKKKECEAKTMDNSKTGSEISKKLQKKDQLNKSDREANPNITKENILENDSRTLWTENKETENSIPVLSKFVVDLGIDFSQLIKNTDENDSDEDNSEKLDKNPSSKPKRKSSPNLNKNSSKLDKVDLNIQNEKVPKKTENNKSEPKQYETFKLAEENQPSSTAQTFSTTHQNLLQTNSPLLSNIPFLSGSKTSSLLNIPFLSGSKNSAIDLNAPVQNRRTVKAKRSAVAWVQNNGPIQKQDPNNIRGTNKGKKRALEALNNLDTSSKSNPEPKKSKIQENEFFSERFKKMMATTSNHLDLLEQRDNEEQDKYFQKLEMKERMEEKMLSTYKVPCKAVRCLTCKYTNFSASDLCKAERHPLKVFDAVKRFFKCGNCGNRTCCLTMIPTLACKNCGSGKWEKTGMMKERKAEIAAPKLSIRGGEQKFVNSVAANANLDLLVPE